MGGSLTFAVTPISLGSDERKAFNTLYAVSGNSSCRNAPYLPFLAIACGQPAYTHHGGIHHISVQSTVKGFTDQYERAHQDSNQLQPLVMRFH